MATIFRGFRGENQYIKVNLNEGNFPITYKQFGFGCQRTPEPDWEENTQIAPNLSDPFFYQCFCLFQREISSMPSISLRMKNIREIEPYFLPAVNPLQQYEGFLQWLLGNQLEQTTQLDWSGIEIVKIPAYIRLFKEVTHLNLSQCQITTLCYEIEQLQSLQELDLSNNPLMSLCDFSQLKNLKVLKLNDIGLAEIPPSLQDLTQLEILELQNNKFISQLPAWFSAWQRAHNVAVNLQGCRLSDLPPTQPLLDYI